MTPSAARAATSAALQSQQPAPAAAPTTQRPPTPRPSFTLYDATDALLDVRLWIDEHAEELLAAGGDLDALPALRDLVELAEGSFETKAERVALFVREKLVEAESQVEHARSIERIAGEHRARAATATKVVEGMKAYLCREMRRAGRPIIAGRIVKLAVQRNSAPSITLNEATALAELTRDATANERLDRDDGWPDHEADLMRDLLDVHVTTTVTVNREAAGAYWDTLYQRAYESLASVETYSCDPLALDLAAQAAANADPLLVSIGLRCSRGSHVRIR